MTEKQIILNAYEDAIKGIFAAFHTAYVAADTATKKKNADKRFVTAVETARAVRDQALVLLPP